MTEEKVMKPERKVIFRLNGKQRRCIQIIDRVSTLMAFSMIICDGLSIMNIPQIIISSTLLVSIIAPIIQYLTITGTPKVENDHDKKGYGIYNVLEFILAILALVVIIKKYL